MTSVGPIHAAVTAAVVVAGALVFAGSLLVGGWAYAWRFGVETPWRSGAVESIAIAVNVLLFTAFALHHSVFARTSVRHWVAAVVSPRLERSAYVWVASVFFVLLLIAWQPVGGTLWRTEGGTSPALTAVQIVGLAITLRAAAALDVLSLAGLRQAFDERPAPVTTLVASGLYGVVRHPLYFGWVLMVWMTPVMTGTRLVFAAVSTLYLVLAIPLEERSLRREFGAAYESYARRVRWKMVWGLY